MTPLAMDECAFCWPLQPGCMWEGGGGGGGGEGGGGGDGGVQVQVNKYLEDLETFY